MEQQKRLYRSKRDKVLCGLCGGLGRYLNIDSNIIRLLFVFVGVIRPELLLAYIVACLVIPEEPSASAGEAVEKQPPSPPIIDERTIIAIVFLVVGITVLATGLSLMAPFIEARWPIILRVSTNLPEVNLSILIASTLIGLLFIIVGLLFLRKQPTP